MPNPSTSISESGSLFIFDTHPIQYRSPVFKKLAQIHPHLKVFYFDKEFEGKKWWFHERSKAVSHPSGLNLTQGFEHCFLNASHGLRKFYQRVKNILKTQRPEAIIIYGYFLPEHWMLWWLSKSLNIPLLFIGEGFSRESKGIRKWIKKIIVPLFFRQVEHFISIGQKNFSFYLENSIERKKLTRARYCVDVSFFAIPEKESKLIRHDVRRKLNIPQDAFVLLYVGRLFDRKRPWDVVALHKKLSKEKNIHTLMVGTGDHLGWIKQMTLEDPHFHVLGQRNQMEIREYYHTADLLILPSEYETWGLVVNEAFAAGLPAVVTEDCGVAMDLVESGKTGFVYPTGKLEVASVIIKWLIENPKQRMELGARAKSKVMEHYSVEQFSKAMMGAFKAATRAN